MVYNLYFLIYFISGFLITIYLFWKYPEDIVIFRIDFHNIFIYFLYIMSVLLLFPIFVIYFIIWERKKNGRI